MKLEDFVVDTRRQESTVKRTLHRNLEEGLASDRSRILYSPAFRRLSRKAQVFSLESNAAVRNRITHSLEVSDVGRLIAYKATKALIESDRLSQDYQLPIMLAVECSCLVHDIGNPPFGHFGESAIQTWFEKNGLELFNKTNRDDGERARMETLISDFIQFDGNPQGLRILLRLKRDRDEYSYNLTYTTILSFLKYTRSATQKGEGGLTKKAGYFESEHEIVKTLKSDLGMDENSRHPLAYIMEAADDIAYCISDIEDGLEKKIISHNEFFNELSSEWKNKTDGTRGFPLGDIPTNDRDELAFFNFKVSYTQKAVQRAADYFVNRIDELLKGKVTSIFKDGCDEAIAFDCLKSFSRKRLFRAEESENIELAGYSIVSGLLDRFGPLLRCSKDQFELIRQGKDDPDVLKNKGLDIEWRLYNRLPEKHKLAYDDQLKEFLGQNFPEWYFRAHMIVDYISGMTDHYALEQYQLLSGIKIFPEQ